MNESQVSEYTEKVDTYRTWNSQALIIEQLEEAFTYLSGAGRTMWFVLTAAGLLVGSDFALGCKVSTEAFEQHADFYRACFEIGRRNKIMNPDVCICHCQHGTDHNAENAVHVRQADAPGAGRRQRTFEHRRAARPRRIDSPPQASTATSPL